MTVNFAPMKNDVLAADGRVIGSRAQQTRRKLLDATAKLLDERGVLELKVVDVTREVGSSPATFYQYFADVDQAILALVDESTEDEKPLVDHLQPGWTAKEGLTRAHHFVGAYMTFWDTHHAILRIRNLKAEEGNRDFREARSRANLLVIDAMAEMVADGQKARRLNDSLDPFTTAAGMIAMIERLLAYQDSMQRRGSTKATLQQTIAIILYQTLTGREA